MPNVSHKGGVDELMSSFFEHLKRAHHRALSLNFCCSFQREKQAAVCLEMYVWRSGVCVVGFFCVCFIKEEFCFLVAIF